MLTDLSLNRGLRKGLDSLKLKAPTDVQAQVIPAALAGKNLLVSAETGSGKTLAYLIPCAQRILDAKVMRQAGTLVLVLVPTRELARQVEKHLIPLIKHTALTSGIITGGNSFKYQQSILRKNPEFIISTPGRLVEMINTESADFSSLQTLVLDEADRMLDMGFREDVLEIIAACNPQRQTLLLSATLRHTGISSIAQEILTDAEQITVGAERSQHSQIYQQVILCDDKDHKEKVLVHLLKADTLPKADTALKSDTAPSSESVPSLEITPSPETAVAPEENNPPTKVHKVLKKFLVFSNTRAQVDKLGAHLRYQKIRAGALHGDLTQEERNHVIALFAEGKINVLVASDVAARGLDVKNIDTVINFDFPRNIDDYVHRIGRTGRAGRQGLAISFVASYDWNLMASVERHNGTPFEKRSIKSLKAKFKGPKKIKSNGKAAGPKKKKKKPEDKKASRHRYSKNKGKRGSKTDSGSGLASKDGLAPLMKKQRPETKPS